MTVVYWWSNNCTVYRNSQQVIAESRLNRVLMFAGRHDETRQCCTGNTTLHAAVLG
jgi:hypothetical protein